jgi:cold shock protein
MAQGTVKWFNDAKGYGFIEPEGGGEDIFAHFSAVQMNGFRTLKQGSRVSYDLMDGTKGKLALNIQMLDEGDRRLLCGPYGLMQHASASDRSELHGNSSDGESPQPA